VRCLARRCLHSSWWRRAGSLLLLWSRLRGGRCLSARRCIGGWRVLLAWCPGGGGALSRSLARRPLVLVVCWRRSALREANSVFYGFGQCRLRGRGGEKHRGTKQKGVMGHWFLAHLGDRNAVNAGPHHSVLVGVWGPPRNLMRQPLDWKRSQHAKTAAKIPMGIEASETICPRRANFPPAWRTPCPTNGFQVLRSTNSFLTSAIAWAGLRPFGQALAQFKMVWQR
jgi:hypothetical protein